MIVHENPSVDDDWEARNSFFQYPKERITVLVVPDDGFSLVTLDSDRIDRTRLLDSLGPCHVPPFNRSDRNIQDLMFTAG